LVGDEFKDIKTNPRTYEFVDIKPPRGLLSNEEARAWTHPRLGRLLLDLLGVWLQIVLSVALYLHFPTPGVYLLAIILIAGAQHACAIITHEGVHYLLLPQNRAFNDKLASWLFASPVLLPFSTYRRRHMDHHRHVSTEDDTKELYRRSLCGWRLGFEVARSLTGLDFLSQVLLTLRDRSRKSAKKTAGKGPGMIGDLLAIGLAQLALMALFSIWDWRLYFLLWVVPLLTFLQLYSKIRSAAEHQPFEHDLPQEPEPDSPYFKGTTTPWLRSIQATPIERLLLTRINFHYHAEHHLWPQVCYQYLPILSRRLKEQRDFQGVVFEGSYLSVITKMARGY